MDKKKLQKTYIKLGELYCECARALPAGELKQTLLGREYAYSWSGVNLMYGTFLYELDKEIDTCEMLLDIRKKDPQIEEKLKVYREVKQELASLFPEGENHV